jgi:hypothetical protein
MIRSEKRRERERERERVPNERNGGWITETEGATEILIFILMEVGIREVVMSKSHGASDRVNNIGVKLMKL